MSRFDSEYYRLYRPTYPAELFDGLCRDLQCSKPMTFADIGCGTGLSLLSLVRACAGAGATSGNQWIGVDPDPRMLAQAKEVLSSESIQAELVTGSAEATGLRDNSVSVILVGSAFHWMDPARAKQEFLRITTAEAHILVFEYQFPKSLQDTELNEWIRRRFNQDWKAPGQTPRGDFKQVTRIFRDDSGLRVLQDGRVPMILPLGSEDLAGLILSQSRVLHYENTLTIEERDRFRDSLRRELRDRMGENHQPFDFYLNRLLLRRQTKRQDSPWS